MMVQVVIFIVTLGLYGIYWFYVTLKEMHIANGKDDGVGGWTVLAIIPLANLFAWWHYAMEYEQFSNRKYPGIAIFILWVVLSPVVWFLVQSDLNNVASAPA